MKIVAPCKMLKGPFLRGVLHMHTTLSDGELSLRDMSRTCRKAGFDFAAVTDHNAVPGEADLDFDHPLVIIPGVEYRGWKHGPELGVIGTKKVPPQCKGERAMLRHAAKAGKFAIFNHPNWNIDHWPVRHIMGLSGGDAIEIYNGVVEHLPGRADSTDVWDYNLSAGRRLLGVACDDAHEPSHLGKGWVMVQAKRDAGSILQALRGGRFYSTTGVRISSVALSGDTLAIHAPNAKEIRFIADRGAVRLAIRGTGAQYRIRPDDIFVRAEAIGCGSQRAWTNPVWVDSPESRRKAADFRKWFLARTENPAKLT